MIFSQSKRATYAWQATLIVSLVGLVIFAWSEGANAQEESREQYQFIDKRPLPKSPSGDFDSRCQLERQQRETFDRLLKQSNQRLSVLEDHLARLTNAQKAVTENAEAAEARHKSEFAEERRRCTALEQALAQTKLALQQANQRLDASGKEDPEIRQSQLTELRASIEQEYQAKLANANEVAQRAEQAAADAKKQLAASIERAESLSQDLEKEKDALKSTSTRVSALQEEIKTLRDKQEAAGATNVALENAREETQRLKAALEDVRSRLEEREKLHQEAQEKLQKQLVATRQDALKSAQEQFQSELNEQVAAAEERVRQEERATLSARVEEVRAATSAAFNQKLEEAEKRAAERLAEVRAAAAAARREQEQAHRATQAADQNETKTSVASIAKPAEKPDAPPKTGNADCESEIDTEPLEAGRLRLLVRSPCRAGQPFLLDYGGTPFHHVLDDDGTLTTELDLFRGTTSPLIARFSDGHQQAVDLTKAELGDVTKVAIVWQAGVNLDLHVLEYAAGFGDKGHVWAGKPGSWDSAQQAAETTRRGRGFLSSTSDGQGEGLQLEVYTFTRSKNQLRGTLSLIVDHASRGDIPRGEMCGSGRFASVGFQMIWLVGGKVTYSGRGLFAVAPCNQKLSKEQRFNRYAVEDLQVR